MYQNFWMNNPQYLAQIGHFFGAYSIVFTAGHFLPSAYPGVVLAMVCYMVVKEFWWDLVYEVPKQTWGDSIMDFGFYTLGIVAATLALKVH